MKKSFMSRVLAVTLSAAMAFSLSSANLVTAEAASKPKLTVSPATATKSSGNRLVILKGAKQKFTVKSVKGWKLTAKSTAAATVSVSKPKTAKPVVTVKGKTASKNATITLTATKGKSKVTKKLYVYVGAKTTTAKLAATSIEVGKTTTLTLKDAKAWKITKATSSKKTVATVKVNSANKVTITGVAAGTSSITATYVQRYFSGKTNSNDSTATKTTKAVKVTVTATEEPTPDEPTPTDVAVTGVTLSSTTPKVGDTLTANVEPSNATNVASYAWYTANAADAEESAWTAIAGATSASYKVTTAEVDKFIKVIVTDSTGKTYPAATTAKVSEDKSADVSIIDVYGTNADGTGIVGDRLELTYGSSFGTPTNITWYRDGSVIATNGGGNTSLNNDGGLFLNVNAARGTGVYKATVVADGKTYTTNELTISAKEDAAVIESFTIEDDYTDGTDLTYNATDRTAVATITLNKNFQGTFRIYKKSDTKFATTIDTLTTALAPAAGVSVAANNVSASSIDGASHLTADAATNYNVLQMTAGSGEGYIARDGKATYKFTVNAGLTRGTEYVVVFDQTSVPGDNIGSGKENVYSSAVPAPYLTKPEKAEVTKAAKNAPIEVTLQDKDGNALTYMGMQTAERGIKAIGAKATSAIYSATKTGVETKDANKKSTALDTANSLKAGVWTVVGTTVTGTDAFWFASIDFNKGIYGAEEFTLRSGDKQVANDAATAATISYSTSAPNDVKVSFGNLRADSTVYLVALNDADGANSATTTATISDELPSVAFARVYNDRNQAVTSADVTAGAGEYTFSGAIRGLTMGDGAASGIKAGNSYIAIIVPKDEVNYSPTYTGSTITTGGPGTWSTGAANVTDGVADIGSTLTTYKVAGKGEFGGEKVSCATGAAFNGTSETALLGYNQFGTELKTVTFAEVVTSMAMTCVNPTVAAAPETASALTLAPKSQAGETGYAVITITAGGTTVNKGEAWSIKLKTGQTLTVTATSADGTPKANATWKVTLS